MNNKMREQFEAWAVESGMAYREVNALIFYGVSGIQGKLWKAWDAAWQAAIASQTCVAKPELPPLPDSSVLGFDREDHDIDGYTADQMRKYGQACADAAQRDKDGNHADDLRGWLDEAREQYEAQDVAFHACSLKLKQAEEELADLRAALSASTAPQPSQVREQNKMDATPSDSELLDFVTTHPEMRLGYHKKRWHFKGFTNYEFDTFKTPREAIAAAIAEMSQPKPE